MIALHVTYLKTGATFEVSPNERFTFGRAPTCSLPLDHDDHGVSRLAGTMMYDHGVWWVINESRNRPLEIAAHTGLPVLLAVRSPARDPSRHPIGEDPVTVVAAGEVLRHALECRATVAPKRGQLSAVAPSPGSTTLVKLTERERDAVTALAWWYLQPHPHYRAEPAGYEEVAKRLGVSSKRVEKLFGQVREKLIAAGYPGLIDQRDARRPVCEVALALRLVGTDSLERLRADRH